MLFQFQSQNYHDSLLYILPTFTAARLRKHQQKTFATLSQWIWVILGASETIHIKKGKFVMKIFFSDNVYLICEKYDS